VKRSYWSRKQTRPAHSPPPVSSIHISVCTSKAADEVKQFVTLT